jgi:preprotein translocase subunit SecD
MIRGDHEHYAFKKAGPSGLFSWCLVVILLGALTVSARAEPLLLDVADAAPGFDQRTKDPIISVRLVREGAVAFAQFTQQHVGRKVEVRVDGKTLVKPVVREPIVGGFLQINVGSASEAQTVATALRSGKARLEVEVAAE